MSISTGTVLNGYRSFYGNKSLQCYIVPKANPITTWGSGQAFNTASHLKFVSLSKGTKGFANSEFYNCSTLKRISLPDGMTGYTQDMFRSCASLSRTNMPKTVTSFGRLPISETLLKELILSPNLTSIAPGFFTKYMVKTTIPALVTSIPANCFDSATSLKKLTFLPTVPPTVANSNAFTNLSTSCIIHVPHGKLNDYKTATNYPDPEVYTYVEDDAL